MTAPIYLFLEPVDVWLFRDGRPFDALSQHRAESIFPPFPSVVQGALRSKHATLSGVDLREPAALRQAIGDGSDYKDLRLRGPFVSQRQGTRPTERVVRYLPTPADAVVTRSNQGLRAQRCHLVRPDHAISFTSAPTPYVLESPSLQGKPEDDPGWLTLEQLLNCLKGHTVTCTPSSKLFVRENRFGIGHDPARRTVNEGALYEAEFIRPEQDVGLLVEVLAGLGDDWTRVATRLLQLGGESRAASFTHVQVDPWPEAPAPLPTHFKVYFATPAYLAGGWQADWTQFFNQPVTLQAAAISRHESLGGFDWATQDHKVARRYVPAGSVYYFTAPEGTTLTHPALTELGEAIGFGQVLITAWPTKE